MAEIDIISTAVIAAGQSLSAEADIGNKVLVGIVLPANWSAAAGGLTFQSSVDGGGTWSEIYTVAGSPYNIDFTAAGRAYLAIDSAVLRGCVQSIKVKSGTAASPVAQASAVALQLVTRLKF